MFCYQVVEERLQSLLERWESYIRESILLALPVRSWIRDVRLQRKTVFLLSYPANTVIVRPPNRQKSLWDDSVEKSWQVPTQIQSAHIICLCQFWCVVRGRTAQAVPSQCRISVRSEPHGHSTSSSVGMYYYVRVAWRRRSDPVGCMIVSPRPCNIWRAFWLA